MNELIARRAFAPVSIYLDIAFLLLFAGLLFWRRRYMTILVGLLAGVLYMAVDYGIVSCRFTEDPKRREETLPLKARIRENNRERVRS